MLNKPERRKIALFSTSFLPYSQTFIYDEIRAHSQNYHLEVFCKDRQNEHQFPYPHFHKPKGALSEIFYQNTAYWPTFNRILKNGNFDLIHAHFGTGAVYALPYIKRHKLPFIVTFHGNDVAALMGTQKYQYNRWRYFLKYRKILQEADLLLAASQELKSLLIELGAKSHKVKVYRLGIDLEKFKYFEPDTSREIISFIMIGRFTEKKGHKYALEALNKVINAGYKAELKLIGSGELQTELEEYVKNKKLDKAVHFKGILSPQEVSQELQNSDVLLAPSVVAFNHDRESGLIVVKEASATGRPVIGTWHGGIYEIINDNKTGFLVPERNSDILADKMIQLIENPQMRKEFGKAGRTKVEAEFDLHKQVQKLEVHYESLIKEQQ